VGTKEAIAQTSAARGGERKEGEARGRKEGRYRWSPTNTEQSTALVGVEQGREDMCSFDDREMRHERTSIDQNYF